jgi:hypothetical protein
MTLLESSSGAATLSGLAQIVGSLAGRSRAKRQHVGRTEPSRSAGSVCPENCLPRATLFEVNQQKCARDGRRRADPHFQDPGKLKPLFALISRM